MSVHGSKCGANEIGQWSLNCNSMQKIGRCKRNRTVEFELQLNAKDRFFRHRTNCGCCLARDLDCMQNRSKSALSAAVARSPLLKRKASVPHWVGWVRSGQNGYGQWSLNCKSAKQNHEKTNQNKGTKHQHYQCQFSLRALPAQGRHIQTQNIHSLLVDI